MDETKNNLTLVGIPLDLGAKNLGVDIGPEAFRYQKVIEKLQQVGFNVTDSGNIRCKDRTELEPGNPHLRYLDEIVRVSEETAKLSEAAIHNNQRIVGLGGDHSINLGLASGASAAFDGNLGLIYFDAHGDINTGETSLTGNIHGMHLASLMGFGAPELAHVYGDRVKIKPENLLHVGGSDFDQAELEFIKRENLQAFTLFDLLSQSLAPLFTMIDDLASRIPNIWISLDLDTIDQIYAPGAGMPNRKGLTYREIATIAAYVGTHCNVVGIDIVEYNPLQDIENKTAELGIELIAKFLGHDYSWYSGYLERNKVEA